MGTRKTSVRTRTEQTTFMADLASVVRFDFNNINSFSFSFVLNKVLELIKTPVAYPIIHSPSSILFSYSFEVFHNDFVSTKIGNNVFADVVIYPLHPTSFSARNLLKKSFTGTSAFTLKFGTQKLETSFGLFDFGRIVKPAVTTDGEVVYSEVNAKNKVLRSIVDSIDLFGKSKQEICSAFFVSSQQAFFNIPTKVFFVTSRNVEFELLSTIKQSQNENVVFDISTSREVIPDRTVFDYWQCFCFFDNSTTLFNATDCELAGQTNTSQMFINKRVQFDVIFDSFFPSSINTILQSNRIQFNSLNYFSCCNNFDFCSNNTSHNLNIQEDIFKLNGGWRFLQRVNSLVSSPQIS